MSGFDLCDDPLSCPAEQNALKEFYDLAKGSEWTVNSNWTDPYIGHCKWYGVKCNDANRLVVQLLLPSNGLLGTLTSMIAQLRFLAILDLNNNNIKVRIIVQTVKQSDLS